MMRLFAVALALLLVSCGEARASDPIEHGKQIYRQKGCASCHQIGSDGGTIGPPLTHIGTVAATREPAKGAADYLRESILDPGAYIVPGYPDSMSRGLGRGLSAEDLDDLITYLLTLK
jgi:mono/diheme cytochrome c family protein